VHDSREMFSIPVYVSVILALVNRVDQTDVPGALPFVAIDDVYFVASQFRAQFFLATIAGLVSASILSKRTRITWRESIGTNPTNSIM
jgi:hypothetical protein